MPWSRDPDSYPSFFHDILDHAREGRVRMTLAVPAERRTRYRAQFYAFKRSWERTEKLHLKRGEVELAAQARANAQYLMRYAVVMKERELIFINKDILAQEEGIQLTASEELASDALREKIAIREEVKTGKVLPLESPKTGQDDLAKRLFGFGTIEKSPTIDLEDFIPCPHGNGMENGCCVDCGEPIG